MLRKDWAPVRKTQRTSRNNPSLEYEDFICHNIIESLNRWGDDKKIRWEEIFYLNTIVLLREYFGAFHCIVRLSTAQHSSAMFAFPLQFTTALGWAGLYTSPHQALAGSSQSVISRVYISHFGNEMARLEPQPRWY